MAHRILATLNVTGEDGIVVTEIRVVDYGSGAAQIETDLRMGTVATWVWLDAVNADAVTQAMRSALSSAGWGSLLIHGIVPVPANNYRKVSII